jgi:DNA invertase Pin-like site-specific DNA recombinase
MIDMATYGYCRVSTLDQEDNQSLPEQERKVRAIADYHGVALDALVSEPGVSGSVPFAKRDAGGELFARLVKGDTLIVSKLDRAFRDAEDALATSRILREKGVRLIVADIGVDAVTDNGTGKLFFTILAAMAEFDRFRIKERTEEGRRAKKAQGGHVGGVVPFGYRKEGTGKAAKLIEVEAEQLAIEHIRTLGQSKVSSRKISQSVMTHYGLRVSHVAVCRILKKDNHV